jgi:hypothetical protein
MEAPRFVTSAILTSMAVGNFSSSLPYQAATFPSAASENGVEVTANVEDGCEVECLQMLWNQENSITVTTRSKV